MKLILDHPLSNFAFEFNFRRYTMEQMLFSGREELAAAAQQALQRGAPVSASVGGRVYAAVPSQLTGPSPPAVSLLPVVGRCRLTLSSPMLKPPGTKRLKLNYDEVVSTSAFNFNLRRYSVDLRGGLSPGALAGNGYAAVKRTGVVGGGGGAADVARVVGWCRLTLSNPC